MIVLIIRAIAPFGCNWLHEPTRNGDKDYGCMHGCMRRCMQLSLAILYIICTKPAHPVEGPRDGTVLFRPAQNQKIVERTSQRFIKARSGRHVESKATCAT